MQLVFSTSPFETDRLPDLLPAFRQCGMTALEIKDTPDFRTTPHLWNNLVRAIQRARIAVPNWHLLTDAPFHTTTTERQDAITRVKHSMERGCQLQAHNFVLHWLQRYQAPEYQAMWQQALDAWVYHATRLNIRLLLETVPDKPQNERYVPVSEIVAFANQYPAEVLGLCLDVNHSNLRERLPDLVALMQARLISLHISDNDGVSEKHWLPGQGVIDFPALFQALRMVGFDGLIVLEAYQWCDDVHRPPRLRQLCRFGATLVRTGAPDPATPAEPYRKGKFR